MLRCLAAIHRVELNGALLSDLQFRFYTHPESGLRGIVGDIPTASLPRGENVLIVEPAPRANRPGRPPPRPPQPYVIPFWL